MLPKKLSVIKPAHIQAEIDDLTEREAKLAQNTKSDSTKRSYKSDFAKFVEWCDSVEFCPHPAKPDTVRLYITWLDKSGRKPSTIRRAITSIRQAHVLALLDSPITEAVKETMKGLFRMRGTMMDKKSAMTAGILTRVLQFIPSDFIGVRDRAMILTGWTGALRRAELTNINVEDIDQEPQGLAIVIRRSKTDQMGAGRRIGLPFIDDNQKFCAARALRKWINLARIDEGPVFRQVGKAGRDRMFSKVRARLNDKQVSRIIKQYVEFAGYHPLDFSGHSLRSGLATTLASAGIEERRIMQITGHKSLPILREYIERGELFTEHPILTVFSKG